MPSTRSFTSPGIFANDATTTIPPTPIAGVSYRDAVNGTADVENGWRYGTVVESQDWNQIMFLITSMMGVIDKKGVIGWSDQVNYTEPALTFGSNGALYIWVSASGPANGGAKDPTSNVPEFWKEFGSSFNSPGDVKVSAVNAPQPGWLVCDGSAVSRSTYSDLFAAIGTTYGAGNGTTTFNVPDTRGLFVRGHDAGRGVDPSRVFGSFQKGSLTAFDPTVASPALAGLHTTGSDALIRQDIGLDVPVPADYPLVNIVTSTPAETYSVAQAAGVSRPANIAFVHLIKT